MEVSDLGKYPKWDVLGRNGLSAIFWLDIGEIALQYCSFVNDESKRMEFWAGLGAAQTIAP